MTIFTAKNYLHNETKTKKFHRIKRKEKLTRDLKNRSEKYGNIKERQTRKSEADQTDWHPQKKIINSSITKTYEWSQQI
jgi:hypothetical protein